MSSTQQVLGAGRRRTANHARSPLWRFQGSDTAWAVAFVVPYAAVFVAFVIYPVIYGVWLGSDPSLYDVLFSDPRYQTILAGQSGE
jgi:multiple sugar transport system permease protein